jgi:hypothetical protein
MGKIGKLSWSHPFLSTFSSKLERNKKCMGPTLFESLFPVSLIFQTEETIHLSSTSLASYSLFSISIIPNRPLNERCF